MSELRGKVALVTGAASGIGAACAVALAAGGAELVLADRAGQAETLARIREVGGRAWTADCDVAEEERTLALFAEIEARSGGLDIAVNSAGVTFERGLLEMTAAEFDRAIGINLRGTFLIGRGAIGLMRKRGAGRFIAVASELAYLGRGEYSAYCASKAGVIGLVRSWAREFAPEILVNAIAPGPVDTPMLNRGGGMSAEWIAKEADIPLGRVGRPEEIAATARFLAGPGASFFTGQTVSPNGGAVML